MQTSEHSSRLGFRYESDTSASFLVLSCDAKLLEYQALMLEHNRIRHVLPVDVVIREGTCCYYYNITSKISLSFFIGRRKLDREEFLKLLLNIASAVCDSGGYLLSASNFVFDPEYLYINPETLEPMLVYVPAMLEGGSGSTLQGFISDLIMQHINEDSFSRGNFIQRLFAEVKSELFNTKALIHTINDLLYLNDSFASDTSGGEAGMAVNLSMQVMDGRKASGAGANKQKETKETKAAKAAKAEKIAKAAKITEAGSGNRKKHLYAMAILLQIVMGGAIYLGRDFLNDVNKNATATYAAVIMIVLAIDLLLFKKINEVKLLNSKTEHTAANNKLSARTAVERVRALVEESSQERPQERPQEKPQGESLKVISRSILETADEVAAAAPPVSPPAVPGKAAGASSGCSLGTIQGKTELLVKPSKGVRMLKSTRNQGYDEDIVISKDDFIIGRLADHVDHIVNNNAVGKLHAQIITRDGRCFIKDLNSVNGTYVNSIRIESNKGFELKDNDRVLLANSEYIYIGG